MQPFVSTVTPVAVQQTLASRRVKMKCLLFIKSNVVSRISPIFTGKNKRFWEFPKRVEMLKNGQTGRSGKKRVYYLGNGLTWQVWLESVITPAFVAVT